MAKPRPIPHQKRMARALKLLTMAFHISAEDLMAYHLALFEKREVTNQSGDDLSEWLTRVQIDGDYPRTLGNDIFERAIAMAARYRL